MNRRIRKMMEELARRGAVLHINENTPDYMTERFLSEVLACPHCRDSSGLPPLNESLSQSLTPFDPDRTPIDRVLAGVFIPRKRGH